MIDDFLSDLLIEYLIDLYNYAWVYIFHFAPRPRGAKIWVFGWLWKKYDDFLGKKANIMEKGVEKREKVEIFTVLGEKNMVFKNGVGGGDKNIQFLGNIYPCNYKV